MAIIMGGVIASLSASLANEQNMKAKINKEHKDKIVRDVEEWLTNHEIPFHKVKVVNSEKWGLEVRVFQSEHPFYTHFTPDNFKNPKEMETIKLELL